MGKIIDDVSGLTEKYSGKKDDKFEKIKPITQKVKLDWNEWKNFQKEVKTANGDEIKIKAAIDDSKLKQLKNLDGLIDYAVKQSKIGKDVDIHSVNKLIQTQNYKNIADQAHGITGVNTAIKEYNNLANDAARTNFAEAISKSNLSLGKYLTGLEGANAGLIGYATSLAATTLKTVALQAATMAMNAAVSFGMSFVISGIITAITNYSNRIDDTIEASHKAKEAIDEENSSFKAQQDLINKSGKRYAELAQHVNQSNNTNLDLKKDEYEEFLELSNQISEQFPGLIKGYDANDNAILNLDGSISDITSTLDTYIDKAKEASQIKIVQAFKGEGENEDYFEGAKNEIDKLKGKAVDAKTNVANLQKLKEIIATKSNGIPDLFGNYPEGSDPRLKADYIRKYMNDSGFDKKMHDDSFILGLSKSLSEKENLSFWNAINDYNLDGQLSDKAIISINEILSKHSNKSGYNFSDYITQQHKTATDDYDQFADDVETKNKEIAQNAQVVLERSVIWSDPDTTDQMRTTMTNALSKVDWSDSQFEGLDGEQAAHYIQTVFASSFEKLNHDDKTTVDKFFESDPGKINLTEYINLYEEIKAIFEKQGIRIPISIDNIQNVRDDFNESLDGMSNEDKKTIEKYLSDHGIDSASELDVWNKRTEGITNATEAIEAYEQKEKEVALDNSSSDIPISFSEAWKELGNESDENTAKVSQEDKEKLLELAETGKLTVEAFGNSFVAKNFLKETGLSAEEATQKINNMKSSVSQLASMKTGISSISSILGEKEENWESKEKHNKGIAPDTLATLKIWGY